MSASTRGLAEGTAQGRGLPQSGHAGSAHRAHPVEHVAPGRTSRSARSAKLGNEPWTCTTSSVVTRRPGAVVDVLGDQQVHPPLGVQAPQRPVPGIWALRGPRRLVPSGDATPVLARCARPGTPRRWWPGALGFVPGPHTPSGPRSRECQSRSRCPAAAQHPSTRPAGPGRSRILVGHRAIPYCRPSTVGDIVEVESDLVVETAGVAEGPVPTTRVSGTSPHPRSRTASASTPYGLGRTPGRPSNRPRSQVAGATSPAGLVRRGSWSPSSPPGAGLATS